MRLPACILAISAAMLFPALAAQAAGRAVPVDYTEDLDTSPARLIAPRDAGFEATPEGLDRKRVGVQRDTLHHCILAQGFPGAEIHLYGSQDQGFADLAAGRIDALLADGVLAYERFLSSEAGREFDFVGDELFDRDCAERGLTAGVEPDLKDRLDDALDGLRRDGALKALSEKYFKQDISE